MPSSPKPEVIILGGGYAGLMALARVRQSGLAAVTLVDARPAFEQRIRHHQHLTGQRSHGIRYESIGGIRFVQAEVERVDAHFRLVYLRGRAEPLPYDMLVYALGSALDNSRIAGAREHGVHLHGEAGLLPLATRLDLLAREGYTATVAGGGLTAIEVVTELAERYPGLRLQLVSAQPLGGDLAAAGRSHLHQVLKALAVNVIEGERVSAITTTSITLASGRELPSALTIPLAGMRANPLAQASGLPTEAGGRLLVNTDLSVQDNPYIFAAGDSAAVYHGDGRLLRLSCACGLPLGAQAGDNVVARLRGRATTPFAFGYVFRCVSLGRREGLIQFVDTYDNPRDKIWTGRRAAWLKESICRYTWMLPWLELHGLRAGVFPRNAPSLLAPEQPSWENPSSETPA